MATSIRSSDVVYRCGVFEADERAGELRKSGTRVKLQEQPWQVLLALLETAGEVVTREELRERLWPTDTFVDFDHSLNIAVNKLRDALDDDAAKPRFIETVPRRGYRFIAPVERIATRPSATRELSILRTRSLRTSRLAAGVAALVVLAIAAAAGRMLLLPRPSHHAIAVLPLMNLSSEPDSDYFSDGLTDQIIYNLSNIEGLEVKSPTSSFEFKGRQVDIRDAGEQLRADLALEGSVLRAAGKMRLTIALVRVADGVTLWSQRYDRETNDVFAIQDEISRAIVNELRLKGVGGQKRYSTDLSTYDLYLRAASLAYEQAPEYESELDSAVALLQQVTARDPQFVPAYAATADAYAHLRNRGRSRVSGERMRQAAEQAIALDPLLPEAQATLGLVRASELRWQEAESAFRRALDLNANLAGVRADFATFVLEPEDKLDEALAQLRMAVELDPLSVSRRILLAFGLLRAGEYRQALDISRTALAANPADKYAGQLAARALILAGRPYDAIHMLEGLGPTSHGYLGYAYAIVGRRREAETLAVETDPAAARHQVLIYAGLGDRQRCFGALQAAAEADDAMADLYPGEPELASLRDDPRMRGFRRQRGLPATR